MAVGDDYRKALVNKYDLGTGWVANWTPGTDVSLGMVGRFKGGGFSREGWLHDTSRGVAWARDPYRGSPDGPWHFQTEKSVTIETRLKGETDQTWQFIGGGKAGIKFRFEQGGGIVVSTASSHEEHISDLKALKAGLIAAFEDGKRMDEGDVIITAVRIADAGFVLISHKSGGEVSATANAGITAMGVANLGELAAGITIASQNGMASAASFPNGFVVAFQGIELVPKQWRWLPRRWRFGHITTETLRGMDSEDEVFLNLPGA